MSYRSAPMSKRDFAIKIFLGSARKSLREIVLHIELLDSEFPVPFLVDKDLDLEFQVTGLPTTVQRFKTRGIKLAADFSSVRGDSICVQGLIGVDVMKYIGIMRLTSFMNKAAFEFPQGVVSFGSVLDFRYPEAEVRDSVVSGINYIYLPTPPPRKDMT